MGNKESGLGSGKSSRQLEIETSNGQWTCGTCGMLNDAETQTKCKMCQTDAPPGVLSPGSSKRGTFFKSLSGRSKRADTMSPKTTHKPSPLDRKKSEPKMAAMRRMRTLVINKEENHALVFVKPSVPKHDLVREHLEEHFNAFKCYLTSEGTVTAEEILSKGVIDKHYSALSKNAMDLNPPKRELSENVLSDFKNAFGIDHADNKVLTLGQFLKMCPDVAAKDIDSAWNAGKRVKVAGGFYIGRLEALEKDAKIAPEYRPLLVVNGFYAAMRSDYITPGNQVLYFTVEWKEKDLSWKDFRALVVGATDPTKADPNSLRGKMLLHWKELGLKEPPSIQNNCVHASAGPIEAMKERATWIGMPLEQDPFAQAMLNEGIPMDLIKSWSENGIVTIDEKTGPAFDMFEDMDSGRVIRCALRACVNLNSADISKGRKQPSRSINEIDVPISPRAMTISSVISERDEPALST